MYFDNLENAVKYEDKDLNNIIKLKNEENFTFNNTNKYKKEANNFYEIENININNYRKELNDKLFDMKEGFNKGNMFLNIYKGYKDHNYSVVVSNPRDKMLLEIQELTFMLKDLGLYLDIHENNMNIFNVFKETSQKLKLKEEEFVKVYGPLAITNEMNSNFDWIKNPWPWDKGEY